jgi:hypothetical protein
MTASYDQISLHPLPLGAVEMRGAMSLVKCEHAEPRAIPEMMSPRSVCSVDRR